jgi:hypothetical protein
MSGLDRRGFLRGCLLCGLSAALAACGREAESPATGPVAPDAREPRARDDPGELAAELRRGLPYLEIEAGSAERYCRDYLRHVGPPQTGARDFHSRFLLSSDFFANGADDGRSVRYVALYDPYLTPCANPFAQLED